MTVENNCDPLEPQVWGIAPFAASVTLIYDVGCPDYTYHQLSTLFIRYMQSTTPFTPTLLPSRAKQCRLVKISNASSPPVIADTVPCCDRDLDRDLERYPGSCYAVCQVLVDHAPDDLHAVLVRLVQLSVARLRGP